MPTYMLFQFRRSNRKQVVGFDLGTEAANRDEMLGHALRNNCAILGECDKAGNLLAKAGA